MCFSKSYLTKRSENLAKRYGHSSSEETHIQQQLEKIKLGPVFYASGFDHPAVPVILNLQKDIQLLSWGLIPNWTKSVADAVAISNTTLNARAETMFEKPSFRESARERRCLVLIDGFFEHHHKNGKTFPYYIKLKNDEPIALAGLWDEWTDESTGISRKTYSVVTTKANAMMAKIHNNPKASDGPRMPLILPKSAEHDWLNSTSEKEDREFMASVVRSYPDAELETFSVNRLSGKNAVGNTAQAITPHRYQELEEVQGSLF